MKISFDFDDTLSTQVVQFLAKSFTIKGYDVHIVTSRMSNDRAGNPSWNDDLFIVAHAVNIPEENIHFCNLKPKHKFFFENDGFVAHLDDDSDDVDGINLHTDTKAVLFVDSIDNFCVNKFEKLIEQTQV